VRLGLFCIRSSMRTMIPHRVVCLPWTILVITRMILIQVTTIAYFDGLDYKLYCQALLSSFTVTNKTYIQKRPSLATESPTPTPRHQAALPYHPRCAHHRPQRPLL
jgi:hypothetical protein